MRTRRQSVEAWTRQAGDPANNLVIDGRLVAAVEEERFTRVKHDTSFPVRAVSYCLETANVRIQDIDHIAITASGVYVIDTKRYRGKIQVQSPLFGAAKLRIAGRDRTRLIDGLCGQVEVVRAALKGRAGDVPVYGCLCFVAPEGLLADVGLPLLRTLKINGCQVYYPRKLARRLNRAGPVSAERALAIRAELARCLLAA